MQPFCSEKHYPNEYHYNTKPMKTFFTLILVLAPIFVGAQCCPYVNNIEIIPAVPTSLDDVKIVTTVTTPNQGMFLSSNHTINGNTINIEACYFSGMLTATQTYYDTLDIGVLSPGIIDINFVAYQSTDTATCNYMDTMSMQESFTVLDNTNSLSDVESEVGRIYPNPNHGTFSIELPNHLTATHVQITDLSGKILQRMPFSDQIEANVQSGIYLIELFENEKILGYQRMIVR